MAGKFPAQYSQIRAARANSQPTIRLANTSATRDSSSAVTGRCGSFDLPSDDRQHLIATFHVPALARNVSVSVKREDDGRLACITCPNRHHQAIVDPITLILTDQNFPPSLPMPEGVCPIIMRVEDALLSDLPSLISEYFADTAGKCTLPAGSLILYGSLSHLANRGLANYTEELVKIGRVLATITGEQCDIAHQVYTPLGGVTSPALVRDLLDLDAWLDSFNAPKMTLPATRSVLWKVVNETGSGEAATHTGERILYLPESIKNGRRVRVISAAITSKIPDTVPPIFENDEKRIVSALLCEINDTFGMGFCTEPDLTRCCSDNVFENEANNRKMVIVGASHASRIANCLEKSGYPVKSLAEPGWKPSAKNTDKVIENLIAADLTPEDVVIMDLLSNTAFCGTDANGLPKQAFRGEDGNFHIEGDLSVITSAMARKVLSETEKLLDEARKANIVLVTPIPRYVAEHCCDNESHLTNFADKSLVGEIMSGLGAIFELLKTHLKKMNVMESSSTVWPPSGKQNPLFRS